MKKVVGFGEIMLRLNPPGYYRLIQSDTFLASYTGAEANVCAALSIEGLDTQFVTKLPDNPVSTCVLMELKKLGVGTQFVSYGGDRLGLYYLEKGASQRPSKVIYDRKYSSISMACREDFNWNEILEGADAFHFTGITAALGGELPEICQDACQAAKKKGILITCDLNYRAKLWSVHKAQSVMKGLMPYVDLVIGNEEDAEKTLGICPEGSDVIKGELNKSSYEQIAKNIVDLYGCKYVAFTLRTSITASDNNWAGILFTDNKAYYSKEYKMHIVDRVGGGDSFAAGMIFALMNGYGPRDSIDYAVAASCLKHTIEKDYNLSSVDEIKALMAGDGSGRVQR